MLASTDFLNTDTFAEETSEGAGGMRRSRDFRVSRIELSLDPSYLRALPKHKSSSRSIQKIVGKFNKPGLEVVDFRTSMYPPQRRSCFQKSDTDVDSIRIGGSVADLKNEMSVGKLHKQLKFGAEGTVKKNENEYFQVDAELLSLRKSEVSIKLNCLETMQFSKGELERGMDSFKFRRNYKISKKGVQGFIRKKLHLGMRPGEVVAFNQKQENVRSQNHRNWEKVSNGLDTNKLLILNTSRRVTQTMEEAAANLITQKAQQQYGELLNSSVTFKLRDLKQVDPDFIRTTQPSNNYYKSLKKAKNLDFHRSTTLTEKDMKTHREELEGILVDFDAIDSLPVENKVSIFANIIGNWLQEQEKDDTNSPGNELANDSPLVSPKKDGASKISKVMSNLFRLIDKSLHNVDPSSAEDILNQLPHFFNICDKLIVKEIEAEKIEISNESTKALSEVCAGLNYLIRSSLGMLFNIPEDYLTNLVKGYLQNLFQVFYDLTELEPDDWVPRLHHIRYQMLNIPENIDGLFSIKKFLNHCLVAEDFYAFFERFYTCILSLIIKSEFFTTTDLYIWRFILDLYSIHFIFSKSLYLNMTCRSIIKKLANVTPENILLRYIALVGNIPHGHLVYDDIRLSLTFNNIQLSKSYQNSALYTKRLVVDLSKAIIKKILVSMFAFIDERYNNESEQRAVISQVSAWMQVVSYYINYSKHYGSNYDRLLHTFAAFKMNFNELLFRMKSRKTTHSNMDAAANCWRLILEACDGLDNQICSPVASPTRKKKSGKVKVFEFKVKR